ncbi:MAG: DASS family sodium-coupled anion symporter [Campylobacterales bacterium]|nr:DASS family sodium-coupled anion symporter [Campylobacterales bacterium]
MIKDEIFDQHAPSRVPRTGFFVGLLFLAVTIFIAPPEGMSQAAWYTVGMASVMAVWWATEALPIPATSLLPIVLIPMLGIDTLGKATAPYANSTIFLFLGGFIIGLALERWNLHKRIALMTLVTVGSNPRAQIAGFMGVTAFISMWVSNTATTIMMLPIGLSVINMLSGDDKKGDEAAKNRFAIALLLGIAYAASLGGIATLIGTPPNALLAGFMNETYGMNLGFAKWMIIGLPVSIIMLIVAWLWLTRGGFNLSSGNSQEMFKEELEKLGKLTKAEKMVGVIFLLTSFAWIFQPILKGFIPGLNDTTIAILAALALFSTPVDVKKRVFLMDWRSANRLPWDVLLLFGGGLSMAAAIKNSGLSLWIAEGVGGFVGGLHLLVVIFIVVFTIQLLTELTSNTATAATFLPLMGALAVGQLVSGNVDLASQGSAAVILAVPTAISASCAFMMPVATPPNAIVFGVGKMKISSMIRNGFLLTFFSTSIVALLSYYLVPLIW